MSMGPKWSNPNFGLVGGIINPHPIPRFIIIAIDVSMLGLMDLTMIYYDDIWWYMMINRPSIFHIWMAQTSIFYVYLPHINRAAPMWPSHAARRWAPDTTAPCSWRGGRRASGNLPSRRSFPGRRGEYESRSCGKRMKKMIVYDSWYWDLILIWLGSLPNWFCKLRVHQSFYIVFTKTIW